MSSDVLERSVIHSGKVFIKPGEENTRAYVIQTGMVRSFINVEDQKVEIARHGPGTIIGETGLAQDEVMTIGYETIQDSTVVTITRQDFEKKLVKADSIVKTTFKHVMNKLIELDKKLTEKAMADSDIDTQAKQLTMALIADVAPEKKQEYEEALLPPLNRIIKELKRLKQRDKDAKNKVV